MHTLKFKLQLLKQQNVHFQNTTSTYQKPYPMSENNFQHQCHRLHAFYNNCLETTVKIMTKHEVQRKMMAVDTCDKMIRMWLVMCNDVLKVRAPTYLKLFNYILLWL